MDALEDSVDSFEECVGLEGAPEKTGEFGGGTGVGVGEATEVGADDFGGRCKEAVTADVYPESAVVPWGVGKGGVTSRGYFEAGGGVDAVDYGGAMDVCGGRLFVAVAVPNGGDEAEAGEAFMEFAMEEIFIGVDADNEAIAVPVPSCKLLEEVPAEGSAGIGEILFVIDEETLVLTVDGVETVFGAVALAGVVGGDHSEGWCAGGLENHGCPAAKPRRIIGEAGDRRKGGGGGRPETCDGSAAVLGGVVGFVDIVCGGCGKRDGGIKLKFGAEVCRRREGRPVGVGFGEAHDIDVMVLLEGNQVWGFVRGGGRAEAVDVVVPDAAGVREFGGDVIAEESVWVGCGERFGGAATFLAGGGRRGLEGGAKKGVMPWLWMGGR